MAIDAALFWHQQAGGQILGDMAGKLLARILRLAKFKPAPGRMGPRVHDLRHAFVVTVCSPGTAKASILSHVSLTWPRILATKTSIRRWCISPSPRNCFSKPASDFGFGAPSSCGVYRRRKRMKPTPFPELLHAFFHEWLVQQRNVSHHTVLSYRDSWRLFLRFVAAAENEVRCQARFGRSNRSRGPGVPATHRARTKVLDRNPELPIGGAAQFLQLRCRPRTVGVAQCAEVLRIPTKQAPKAEVSGLDEDEISAILAQPDRSRIEGQRDHVLLAVLYNTGARIQEALNLSPRALRLESPFQVRLFGKGRKERICPLWPETVELLKAFWKGSLARKMNSFS